MPAMISSIPAVASVVDISSRPNPTIEPYTMDLNGVDQPRNDLATKVLWGSLGFIALVVFVVRLWERTKSHLRRLYTMNAPAEQQVYWGRNHSRLWPKIKQHLTYAPLFSKRHNRAFEITSKLTFHIGTVPSRFHSILIILYILSNFAYCTILSYGVGNKFQVVAEFRGRTGSLAVANMITLVLFAGRNNPLIRILGVSFDTYNLFHRWIGRMVVLEILAHSVSWTVSEVFSAGWAGVRSRLSHDTFLQSGMIGFFAMMFIIILSISPVRHLFYETFLSTHIILVALVMACAWMHTAIGVLPQLPYIQVAVSFWAADRLLRLWRIFWYNYSKRGWTTATVEALSGDVSRVTLHLPNFIEVKPGSHAYLRFSGVRVWESHPFSIAWVRQVRIPTYTLPVTEKVVETPLDKTNATTQLIFLINARSGMTRRLFNTALKHQNTSKSSLTIRAAFEGPYGGHHSLDSYGHAILFAGSSGITHASSFLEHLAVKSQRGIVSTRKCVLIWVVRDRDCTGWITQRLEELKDMIETGMCEVEVELDVRIYVTKPKDSWPDGDNLFKGKQPDNNDKTALVSSDIDMSDAYTGAEAGSSRPPTLLNVDVINSGMTVTFFRGRPCASRIVREEVQVQVGAMCVSVCGPGSLGDDVRAAVRDVQSLAHVDLVEESFTW